MLLFSLLALTTYLRVSDASIVCSAERAKHAADRKCGYRGTLRSPNPIRASSITTTPPSTDGPITPFRDCLNTCLVNSACQSWSFNFNSTSRKACTIYGSLLKAMKPRKPDPSSSRIFYDKDCANATLADAYLNTDFETGDLTGWFASVNSAHGNISVISGETYGRTGYVAKLESGGFADLRARGSNDVEMFQFERTLCNGTNYELSFDYYIPSDGQAGANPGACQFILEVKSDSEIYDTERFMRFSDLPSGTYDKWQHVEVGVYPGTDERNTLAIYMFTGPTSFNTILLDNIFLSISS